MIAIIDYGVGNLGSIENALRYLDLKVKICSNPDELRKYSKYILPGVGSFRNAKESLVSKGFVAPLNECILKLGRPILGICLGMQLFAEVGEEDGPTEGLGWLKGKVVKMSPQGFGLKVPHIGFNQTDIGFSAGSSMFRGLGISPYFYYLHSYALIDVHDTYLAASTTYGEKITASVVKENIWGCQFHPEKSQQSGLSVLRNFGNI